MNNLFNINDVYATLGILGYVDAIKAPFLGLWNLLVSIPIVGTIINFFEDVFGSGATVL